MTLLEGLVEVIDARRSGRLVVAIDGPDAAGKTTLARAVADRLTDAICVSVDGWHRPRAMRQDYYRDSFDVSALADTCVQPFVSGAGRIRTTSFDHVLDAPADVWADVVPDSVLVVEGVFLLRPELRSWWDVSVYLHVPESVTLARAVSRDLPLFGSEHEVRRRYETRYLPALAQYRAVVDPMAAADVVIDNTDPAQPRLLRWF